MLGLLAEVPHAHSRAQEPPDRVELFSGEQKSRSGQAADVWVQNAGLEGRGEE